MIQIKLETEKIILALFFAVFLFIGPGSIFGHRISHDFPFGYFASDAFQHQVRAQAIKDAGNFRYEADYISKGFENVVGRYPPVMYHLAVLFSYSSGLEVYDSIYFVVMFFAIMGIFAAYIITKSLNRNAALISLPLGILVFSFPLSIGFTWGHWPSLLSQVFLIAFFWCISRIELEKSYILIAIIFTSIVLAHTSEAIFSVIFLAMYFAAGLISKNLKINEIKILAIAFGISFMASLYYLTIFKDTWVITQPYSFFVQPLWEGNPGFYISDFGVLLVFIAIGILFSLSKIKDMPIPLVLAFAMLLTGFLNYAGFGLRSFQARFFWPVYLSVFFGFGIYMLLKLAVKNWNVAYTIAIAAVFTVLLSGILAVPFVPHYVKSASEGIMDTYHWAMLGWLGKNAESNSRIYFFYGDIYSQDALLRNSKRVHFQVNPDDFINAIKDKKIKKSYVSKLPGDDGGSLGVRTGLFSFKDISQTKPQEYYFGPKDICTFDYFVFDKVSRQQVLAQYNLLIANEMLKKGAQKVFENQVSVILKNNNPGADCIEERNF